MGEQIVKYASKHLVAIVMTIATAGSLYAKVTHDMTQLKEDNLELKAQMSDIVKEKQAGSLKSDYGLINHGLSNLRKVYWNLPTESLYEEIIFRGEGHISKMGPILVDSGKHTARAANDTEDPKNPGD